VNGKSNSVWHIGYLHILVINPNGFYQDHGGREKGESAVLHVDNI
jgi:hypothetical protein